jgi:molybdate transport system substrate-binding protein
MPFTRLPILVALLVLSSALTRAADIRVVSSGGFAAAYRTLAPQFEKTTGNHLITGWGPSMGNTTDAVPQRLARNEPIDVVIMVGPALGRFVEARVIRASSGLPFLP